MKLICYPTSGVIPDIRPAPASRAWMDATPDGYAYRCLPLNIANAHGWEVLSPCRFEAVWQGGIGLQAIDIFTDAPQHLRPTSHFGSGILTFHVLALFRTEPGFNLWVTGPVNTPKDGIVPLSGVVEADWAPYTFTMNWKFTRPGRHVTFEKGEPFCFFFPVPRGVVDSVEPEIRTLDSDPETAAAYQTWLQSRSQFLKELGQPASPARQEKWQKKYYFGHMPDGHAGSTAHQTKLRPKPFLMAGEDAGADSRARAPEK